MYEGFTGQSRRVMLLAHREAHRFGHDYIGTEHILLGVLLEGSRRVAALLQTFGVSVESVRVEVEKTVRQGPEVTVGEQIPLTPPARRALGFASKEAARLRHDRIGPEHLLLGVLHEADGEASQVLLGLGLDLERLREETLKLPPPEDRDVMVQPAGAPGVALAPDPSADTLERLVTADVRPPARAPSPKPEVSSEPLVSAPSLAGLALQLKFTQVVLGALAGGVAGGLIEGRRGAIVGVLVGMGVALQTSTVLGVVLGLAAGMLVAARQVPHSPGLQVLALLSGLVIGSCFGSFLRGFARERPAGPGGGSDAKEGTNEEGRRS
jgi:ATP-dependent Clp protease ATP-binding subunit ClpC